MITMSNCRALAGQRLEHVERIAFATASFDAVARGVARGELERGGRAVDADHLAGAVARGAHAPGAHVAEHVENPRACAHVLRRAHRRLAA